MTERDFQLTLVRAYYQTPETQTDFLLAEAEKFKVNPINFYKGLSKAYTGLEQYLNSSDNRSWSVNDKGEREYHKRSLNLYQFTNGELVGSLFSQNLPGILKVVHEFGQAVLKESQEAVKNQSQESGKMYFLLIILEGYFHKNSRENLKDYFLRKFDDAKNKDSYRCNEFFDGLLDAVDGIENEIDLQIFREKKVLYNQLSESDNKQVITHIKSENEKLKNPDHLVTLNFPTPIDDNEAGYISLNGLKRISSQIELAKNSVCKENGKQISGFKTSLSDEQIKSLFEQMQEFWRGDHDCFKAIFRQVTVLENFEKVVWLKRKTHLREFFTLLNITPTQRIIKELICDEKGNEIVLPKPKKNEFSLYYGTMEKIITEILKTRPNKTL